MNTVRPKSALVTSNWSAEQMELGVALKSNLSDSSRGRRTKRVTFGDEYDLAGDHTALLNDEEIQPRDVQVSFIGYREKQHPLPTMILPLTKNSEKHHHLQSVVKSSKPTIRTFVDNSFDDADFDKNLDFEISDVTTPPDGDSEAGLSKLSDESTCSIDEFRDREVEMEEGHVYRNNRQNQSSSSYMSRSHKGRSTIKLKRTDVKQRNVCADSDETRHFRKKNSEEHEGVEKEPNLFSDQGLEMSASFCNSASFELAKTALTQYADLLKAAQADRAKAATRRSRPASNRQAQSDATRQSSSVTSSKSGSYVVTSSKFEDVGLSGSVDSLNSDIVGHDFTDEVNKCITITEA